MAERMTEVSAREERQSTLQSFCESLPEPFGRPRANLAARADSYVPGLVSVIIPCYNNATFVGMAIESALGQTYQRCEVIVIDDGSTDESPEIVSRFGGRIRWQRRPNGGAPAARNDGLELARGEFIQFLDGDDLLLKDAVERRLEAMTDRCDSVFGDEKSIDAKGEEDGVVLRHRTPWWPPADMATYIVMHNIRTPQPLHRRRNVYRAGGFDEAMPRSQEPDFHLRMFFLGHRFKHLPSYVSMRRRHGHKDRIGNARWMSTDPDRYLKLVRHWLGLLSLHCENWESHPLCYRLAALLYGKASEVFECGFTDLGYRYLGILRELFPDYQPEGSSRLIHRLLGFRSAMRYDRLKLRMARSRWGVSIRNRISGRLGQ